MVGTWRDARRFGKEMVDAMYRVRGTIAVSSNVGDRYVRLHQAIQKLVTRIDALRQDVPANHRFFDRDLSALKTALGAFAPPTVPNSRCKARFVAGNQEFALETIPRGPATVEKVRLVNAALAVWIAYIAEPPAARKGSLFSRVLAIACKQAAVALPGRVVVAQQVAIFKERGVRPAGHEAVRIWVKSTSQA
ncbi:hypothetical protein RN01_03935 [Cupriavidus sp. SHE]|nr:hypothetical protein C3Z06_29840 [Cupriavidus metallidurans]KWR85961.1 hypothetical protein RN01_03935 [Cupriavidus sp. SHE]